jgi:hypothetical protein
MGLRAQGVVDALLARVSELQFCEHDQDGFSMWIATRPGMLLCQFCYQAAQVLARTSSARPAGIRPQIRTPTRSWWSSSLTGSARTLPVPVLHQARPALGPAPGGLAVTATTARVITDCDLGHFKLRSKIRRSGRPSDLVLSSQVPFRIRTFCTGLMQAETVSWIGHPSGNLHRAGHTGRTCAGAPVPPDTPGTLYLHGASARLATGPSMRHPGRCSRASDCTPATPTPSSR